MLFLYLLASVSSRSHTATIEAGDHGYTTIPDSYNEANLHIKAGEGLMMVEWKDAVLTISIPSIGIEDQQFYNSLGYSLFTFKNDADIIIKFNSQISYFYFPGPYLKTNGAYQFISNINSNEFRVNTNLELYFGTFGSYDLSTSLSINGGNGHVIYCQEKDWIDKDFIRSLDLKNIKFLSVLQNTRNTLMLSGSVYIDSKESYTPTVPTRVALEYGKIETNEKKINENMAFGGDVANNNGKSNKLIDLYNMHYITLISDMKYDSDCSLFYRDDDGEYKNLYYFNKEKDSEFEVEVFVLSEKCKTYTLVKKFRSSKYKFGNNGYLENISINNDFLPKNCLKDKAISGTLIACIVLAIVLVIVIIVFVVIIVKQRKKSNSSQEGKSTENI